MDKAEEILVTPKKLRQKAIEWNHLLKKAYDAYERVEKIVLGTDDCFAGRTAEQWKAQMRQKKLEGQEQLVQMRGLPIKLFEIAKEYETAERENQNAANRN